MKKLLVAITCFAFVAAQCRADDDGTEKTITKSFTVQPGGEINVDADEGDIDVQSGTNSTTVQIVVERIVNGGSQAQQEKVLKAHKVTFDQNGKKISVDAKSEKKRHSFFSREPNLNVHFHITVPRRFDATLNTDGGNISVTDLKGTVDARTSGGNEDFVKIEGRVDGHTSGGNVAAADCTDALTIETSGGNIHIKNYTGPSAQADTSGGNIVVKDCAGKLQVRTSGGNINIGGFSGASVFADTSGGTVSIDFDKEPTENCLLRTSGGSVTARMPENLALNLAASTDGGSVSSTLPVVVQGKKQEGKLEGTINGGGPNLVLHTSGGDIRVEKK